MKHCFMCGQDKDTSLFGKDKRSPDGFCYQCKSCKNAKEKKYREGNIEHTRALSNARVNKWRDEHPLTKNKSQNAYSKKHPEVHKAYRDAHKEQYRVHHRNRYASTKGFLGAGFSLSEWKEKKNDYGGRCVYCGNKPRVLEMDHIIPLSGGGMHSSDNIVPACRSCNGSKSNKPLLFWLYSRMRTEAILKDLLGDE